MRLGTPASVCADQRPNPGAYFDQQIASILNDKYINFLDLSYSAW
jgi:hypothetical protein